MSAIRHTEGAVLDAVRECVLAVGVRRTTLSEVARRAGLSRMTLYRRYPDVAALVRDLMTREFRAVLRAAHDTSTVRRGGSARARLIASVVTGVACMRANELFRQVLAVDPESLLPYIIARRGSTQQFAVEYFTEGLAAGQADGSVRADDLRQVAHGMLLIVQSFVHSARTVGDVLDDAALDRELARALDGYLAP